jgi:seryl-tRNA synthetase (EC 6.1.1.11)
LTKNRVAEIKGQSKVLEDTLRQAEQDLQELLVLIPNLPSDEVPEGRVAEDNVVEKTGGIIPELEKMRFHIGTWTKKYDLIDFELGVKITGAGFPVYKGKGARLQRALINYFLDKARESGYLEVQPLM